MQSLKEILGGILRVLSSLPEEKMRLKLLGARLAPLDPAEVAVLLDVFYSENRQTDGAMKLKAILVDPDGLKDALGSERYRLTYLAALDMGLKRVSRLFTDLPPKKTGIHGYDKEEEAKMEFVTLGQRRAMSKGNVKDTLDRLLSDPDVMVVGNLLNNPRITELEVLKIASKRPNSPAILKLLATHRKWSKRYPVIKAVARNPYTAPRLAAGLLEFLFDQDLKEIAVDGTLHPQLRLGARELKAERIANQNSSAAGGYSTGDLSSGSRREVDPEDTSHDTSTSIAPDIPNDTEDEDR